MVCGLQKCTISFVCCLCLWAIEFETVKLYWNRCGKDHFARDCPESDGDHNTAEYYKSTKRTGINHWTSGVKVCYWLLLKLHNLIWFLVIRCFLLIYCGVNKLWKYVAWMLWYVRHQFGCWPGRTLQLGHYFVSLRWSRSGLWSSHILSRFLEYILNWMLCNVCYQCGGASLWPRRLSASICKGWSIPVKCWPSIITQVICGQSVTNFTM